MSNAATDEILKLREEIGMHRSDIVRRVEEWDPRFSETQFWRIQNGRAHWTLDRFVFAAAALGLDPAMLLDRILRAHDIMAQLRARDGPGGDADEQPATPATPPSS